MSGPGEIQRIRLYKYGSSGWKADGALLFLVVCPGLPISSFLRELWIISSIHWHDRSGSHLLSKCWRGLLSFCFYKMCSLCVGELWRVKSSGTDPISKSISRLLKSSALLTSAFWISFITASNWKRGMTQTICGGWKGKFKINYGFKEPQLWMCPPIGKQQGRRATGVLVLLA